MRQLSTRGQDEQPASPRENWIYYSKMAHRELQGRLQIAEQQARMYREAMAHLMEAATVAYSGPDDTSPSNSEEDRCQPSQGSPSSPGQNSTHDIKDESDITLEMDDTVISKETAESVIQAKVSILVEGGVDQARVVSKREELHRLEKELESAKRRRAQISSERDQLARETAELSRCRGALLSHGIALDAKRSDLAEARESCRSRKALYSEQLVSAMNMGALNDSFHIWNKGPFATINGFRVGRLQTHLVDWQEVNAGVGQAAIVLVTVAMAIGMEFSKYIIAPCGSFTKIARSEDGRILYSLHTDESFSLFPRRNFNSALKAFLHCLGEIGDHVQEHDPTLRLPYRIKEKDGTIGGLPVSLGSSLEDWTRALKYMITDLKWIAAWAAKYIPPC